MGVCFSVCLAAGYLRSYIFFSFTGIMHMSPCYLSKMLIGGLNGVVGLALHEI